MSTKEGGPAFPRSASPLSINAQVGMSLRDYCAVHAPIHDARALGGWRDPTQRDAIYRAAAEHAYRFADAMLAARRKP